jgi:hypothetical protein
MRRIAAMLVVSAVVVSCGGPRVDGTTSETPEIMAVALTQLVTVDNTFGEGPPPFTEYLIQTKIDPSAGDGVLGSTPVRELTEDERSAIEEAISAYGPVTWIDNPTEWRTPELTPVIEGSVILGVGEPVIEEDSALVPMSLWCGGLCGTWFSYRVDLVDGEWTVSGIEGPVMVS